MRQTLLLFSLLFCAVRSYAQDVILQTSGEEIPGKVLTITSEEVTYLSGADAHSDTLRLAAASVFLIRYANGTRKVLHPVVVAPAEEPMSKEQAYSQGRLDARKYYKAPGVFWGTYAATVFTGYGGPIVGVAAGATKPKVRNFIVPEAKLLQDPHYVAGYRQQAHNKKVGSALGGFGAGVGTLAVVVAVIAAAFVSNI